jgi:ABC-type sugar transport system substrate-binding protein
VWAINDGVAAGAITSLAIDELAPPVKTIGARVNGEMDDALWSKVLTR